MNDDLFWEKWKRGEIKDTQSTSDPQEPYQKPHVNNLELAIIASRSDNSIDALTKLRDRYEAIILTQYTKK